LACPACNAGHWRDRGRIPPASEFAGQVLARALPGGRLLECGSCGLNWRSIVQAPAFYEALYASASGKLWQPEGVRPDHRLVADTLLRHLQGGSVLDIGCGSGALLSLLPERFRRCGIEIGVEARTMAAAHGVELLGSNIADLDTLDRSFDAIVACDVVEHFPNPKAFIESVMRQLRPGGLLLLSTGDASAWLWRLCGGNFWYCQYAEHLSFVSPRWLADQDSSGAELVELQRFAYGSLTLASRIKLSALLGFYLLAPTTFGRWLAGKRGLAAATPFHANPPGQGLTRDHMVAVLRRVSRSPAPGSV
jgi:SAM-dependent methyltransferase